MALLDGDLAVMAEVALLRAEHAAMTATICGPLDYIGDDEKKRKAQTAGEGPGHEFRGNQWVEGQGGDIPLNPITGALNIPVATMSAFNPKIQAKILANITKRVVDPPTLMGERYRALLDAAKGTPTWDAGLHWYEHEHDNAAAIATANDTTLERVVGAAAAISPGTEWGSEWGIVNAMLTYDQGTLNLPTETLAVVNDKLAGMGLDTLANGTRFDSLDSRSAVMAMREQLMADKPDERYAWSVPYGYGNFAKGLDFLRSDHVDEGLNGVKVRSFYDNIVNPRDNRTVTVDVKMLQAASGDKFFKNDSAVTGTPSASKTITNADGTKTVLESTIGPTPYVADVVRSIAGDYGILPQQAQAIIWTQWNATRNST